MIQYIHYILELDMANNSPISPEGSGPVETYKGGDGARESARNLKGGFIHILGNIIENSAAPVIFGVIGAGAGSTESTGAAVLGAVAGGLLGLVVNIISRK